MTSIPQQKIDALIARFDKVEAQMASATKGEDIVRLSREHGELKAVAEKARELGAILKMPVVQAFANVPLKGSSHPKENARRPGLLLKRAVSEPVLLVDDVATSGAHLEEAAKLLRPHCRAVLPIAWISGNAAGDENLGAD